MVSDKRNRKTKTRASRPTRSRRKREIQELPEQEVQALKAVATFLQEAVDSYRRSFPKRLGGPVRAILYFRFGTSTREVHYALPKGILPSSWIQSVRLAAERGRIPEDRGEAEPFSPSDVSGGLPGDAGVRGQRPGWQTAGSEGDLTPLSTETLRRLRARIYRELDRRGHSWRH